MRILIIGGGNAVSQQLFRKLCSWAEQVICADAGAEIARQNNFTPTAVVGDFDSISRNTLAYFERKEDVALINIQEQDTTDMEKSIKLALNLGASHITLTCVGGKRNDHFMHTLGLMLKFDSKAAFKIVDDDDIIYLKTQSFREKCMVGERVSLIPYGGIVKNVSTSGLKYQLINEDLTPGVRESISNLTIRDIFSVNFTSGTILLFKNPSGF